MTFTSPQNNGGFSIIRIHTTFGRNTMLDKYPESTTGYFGDIDKS